MKRRRKSILLILAALNIVIIGLLGIFVVKQKNATPPTTAAISPCSQVVLSKIEPYLSPAVAWETGALTVMTTVFYSTPNPPDASAQLLWDMLDSIKHALELGCDLPAEVTLIIQAHGQMQNTSHVALLNGADIAAWTKAELSDTELSLRGKYWQHNEIQPVRSEQQSSPN